jgi:hypothetical protein
VLEERKVARKAAREAKLLKKEKKAALKNHK